jgi:DNA-3-methyladenine glycosylase I
MVKMSENKLRCPWVENTFDEYVKYHDEEWGKPVHDDRIHFEFITLEGAQAGLSWSTILKRRDGYSRLFEGFDAEKVSRFSDEKVTELAANPAIVRHRKKVESAVTNAQAFLQIQEQYGSFDNYIWDYVDGEPLINHFKKMEEVPAETELSGQIAKDLKKHGFTFVGSTIIYAYMQACGLVNDHLTTCYRHKELLLD